MFSGDKTAARKLYRVFMGGGTVRREDIYSTIDQRLLGGERFIEKVMGRYNGELSKGKRAKGYTLNEIAKGVEKVSGVTLKQIRGKSKSRDKTLGRKLISLIAKEYGYKGKEIAEYIRKDPAIVTRDIKGKVNLQVEIEKLISILNDERTNVNSQA